ncbi:MULTISPECIES: hypothetical protein [Nostocales]|uniref:Uncharacterized protein n=3 Tax=Nostocales TaxID=1161 RepID=A0A8S9T5K0_9CYAN|nr:hypothetical protein [Tolypothrix bouteillei]KAF3886882.1 hypothetical protein DA73_0400016350 [Tolypothrix bouteillei VB521301]
MATRQNLITNFWHKVQEDSVGWGSLMLWVVGMVMLLLTIVMFSTT